MLIFHGVTRLSSNGIAVRKSWNSENVTENHKASLKDLEGCPTTGGSSQLISAIYKPFTPPKFNIAPEKWWLEDYFLIGKVTFQGLC